MGQLSGILSVIGVLAIFFVVMLFLGLLVVFGLTVGLPILVLGFVGAVIGGLSDVFFDTQNAFTTGLLIGAGIGAIFSLSFLLAGKDKRPSDSDMSDSLGGGV